MSRGLEIAAIGGRCAVGLVASTTAAAVRAGINRHRELPFVTEEGEPMVGATDARLDLGLEGADRMVALGKSVLDELAGDLAHTPLYRVPVSLHLALPEPRPGVGQPEIDMVTHALVADLRDQGAQPQVEVPVLGHAGVALAMERAVREAEQGHEQLHIVLGVDSYHHPETWVWLEAERRFGPLARGGIVPGEGAAALLLASPRLRQQLGLPSLAAVAGVGVAHDPLGPSSETGSFGEGMTRAIQNAVASCRLPGDVVHTVFSDISGERYRSEEWGFVAMRIPSAFARLEYQAPADCWGDVGAATGALACVLAARSWARGYAAGPRALVMAGSLSGARGAILLQEPPRT